MSTQEDFEAMCSMTTQHEREQFVAMLVDFVEKEMRYAHREQLRAFLFLVYGNLITHTPREQLRVVGDAMLRYRLVCQPGDVLHAA